MELDGRKVTMSKYETKMDRQEAEGFTVLDTGVQEYHCPASDYKMLLDNWTRGIAFVTTSSLYNEECVVKLAKVESITLVTPESYKMRIDTDNARKNTEITGGQ
jgi:hypothetical protein